MTTYTIAMRYPEDQWMTFGQLLQAFNTADTAVQDAIAQGVDPNSADLDEQSRAAIELARLVNMGTNDADVAIAAR